LERIHDSRGSLGIYFKRLLDGAFRQQF